MKLGHTPHTDSKRINRPLVVERIEVAPPRRPRDTDSYGARLLLECVIAVLLVLAVCGLTLWLNTLLPKGF